MMFDPRVWAAIVLSLIVAFGAGKWQQHGVDAKQTAAERTKAALDAARIQVKAIDEARIEEQRRTAAQTRIANDAIRNAELARMDAEDSRAAADGLRVRIAEYVSAASRTSKNPPPVGGSAPASGADDLLALLLEKSVDRAVALASYADAARVAGQACVESYDALTPQ